MDPSPNVDSTHILPELENRMGTNVWAIEILLMLSNQLRNTWLDIIAKQDHIRITVV
jgi:hypothetical protein